MRAEELLLREFDRLSEAPRAVEKLREFVVELTVRGRLGGCRSGDGDPFGNDGGDGDEEVHRTSSAQSPPFDCPPRWRMLSLGSLVSKLGAGSTPLGGKSIYSDDGVPFIRSQNVHNDGLRLEQVARIPRRVHERMDGTRIRPGDVLLNITGASIGRCCVVPDDWHEGNVSQHVAIIRLLSPENRRFIQLLLISPSYQRLISAVEVGVSREGLSMRRLKEFPIALPPLHEQHRIVERVRELISLCDELEAAQAERERRRAAVRIVTAASRQSERTQAADIFLKSFAPGFTEIGHLDELRRTILSLGVRGCLSAKGGHPIRGVQTAATETRLDLDLPNGWRWTRLSDVAHVRLGKMLDRAKNKGDEYPYLRNTNVHWFEIRTDDLLRLRMEEHEAEKYLLLQGDVLICEGGHGIGRTAVWRGGIDRVAFQKALHRVRPGLNLESDFFSYCMAVYAEEGVLAQQFTGVGIPHLTGEGLKRLEFPLPSLAEQRAIVARIQELFAQIQQLQTCLGDRRRHAASLLESVLAGALTTSSVRTESAPQHV